MKTRLIRLNATDSTNSYIKTVAQPDDELLVVSARWQTAGRGQGSNHWESEEGESAFHPIGAPNVYHGAAEISAFDGGCVVFKRGVG